MRAIIAVLLTCLLSSVAVAKPSQHGPVHIYDGDRLVRVSQLGPEVTKATRCPPPLSCTTRPNAAPRWGQPAQRRATKPRKKTAPVPRPRPGTVAPLTMAEGVTREVGRAVVIGSRPAGCPHRFCGCALAIKLFGRIVPHLNLAANWLRFPRTPPAPGMVAARRGHVFKLLAHIGGSRWQVWDANSGRGRIRIHPRSIAGYVIVNPHGQA